MYGNPISSTILRCNKSLVKGFPTIRIFISGFLTNSFQKSSGSFSSWLLQILHPLSSESTFVISHEPQNKWPWSIHAKLKLDEGVQMSHLTWP
jgi:hypothetical protein